MLSERPSIVGVVQQSCYLPRNEVAIISIWSDGRRTCSKYEKYGLRCRECSANVHGDLPQMVKEKGVLNWAKEVLGPSFFGAEHIHRAEERLRTSGVNVDFILDGLPEFPFTRTDIEFAAEEGEKLVLRAEYMHLNGKTVPITLSNFRQLFHKKPLGKRVFGFQWDWVGAPDWAKQNGDIKPGWSLVSPRLLKPSVAEINRTWGYTKYGRPDMTEYALALEVAGCHSATPRIRAPLEVVWDEFILSRDMMGPLTPHYTETKTGKIVYLDYHPDGIWDSGLFFEDPEPTEQEVSCFPNR